VTIQCTYVPTTSSLGVLGYVFSGLGVLICLIYLIIAIWHRNEKIMKRSQPIFTYLFISGSILLNLTIIAYIGENTNQSCLIRPWVLNLSGTMMFAPLIMKLHRVDRLFNNPKLKKMKITDLSVLMQVSSLIMIDVILLLAWTFSSKPAEITQSTSYSKVLFPVEDHVCNTGLSETMEQVMLAFKALMLLFGVVKVSIFFFLYNIGIFC